MAAATKTTTLWALPTVKHWIGIKDQSDETEDQYVVRIADAVSEMIENQTRRVFVTRSITEVHDSHAHSRRVFLYRFPVTGVSSVTLRWSPGEDPEAIASDYYDLIANRGILDFHGMALPEGIGNLTVVYSAGYGVQDSTALPQDIVTAGLELVKAIYTEKTLGVAAASSVNVGDNTFILRPDWPKHVKVTLDRWKVVY